MRLGKLGRRVLALMRSASFPGSAAYWESRYRAAGSSGKGSEGRLARFKADFLNDFLRRNQVERVIELGCGDGRQLSLIKYASYFGVDVSETAVELCKRRFSQDPSKRFSVAPPDTEIFDLSISMDVIYHLTEDSVYHNYMDNLFSLSEAWVILYSSDIEHKDFVKRYGPLGAGHVKHRRFSDWVQKHAPEWCLALRQPNIFPYDPAKPDVTSFADFHVYCRRERE